MDWMKLAFKLPMVITGITAIVNRVKGAPDEDKKAAIIASLQLSVSLAELTAGHDIFKDEAINSLIEAVVDAERAVEKAREALKGALVSRA